MARVLMRLRDFPQPMEAEIDPAAHFLRVGGRERAVRDLAYDVPTIGTVYGTALNFHGALAALDDAVNAAPYHAPPKAPVLYVKPANTWIGYGAPIPLPSGIAAVQIGATLGIVIGRAACRVPAGRALDFVAGYTIVNDVSVPHDSVYRPAVRHQCRDGFCPMGPWILRRDHVANPDALAIRAYVNDALCQQNTTANLIRPVARLLADVTEFITLCAGDVLLVGVPEAAPQARAGDRVVVEIEGVGRLENPVVAQSELAVEIA